MFNKMKIAFDGVCAHLFQFLHDASNDDVGFALFMRKSRFSNVYFAKMK
jgi:hypothetical protein